MPRQEWSFFMPAEDHKQIKWLFAYFQYRFTPWGQVIHLVIMLGIAMSSVGTQISAYFLPSFILALILTAYFLSLFYRPKIEAYRVLPPFPSAGGVCLYNIIIKNIGKRRIRNLAIFERCLPYGLYQHKDHHLFNNTIDWLEPNQQTTVTLVFRTPRRGTFELPDLIAGSSFPSGILYSTRRVGKREKFIVYPQFIRQSDFHIPLHRMYQPGGISLSSKVGDSNEFASTREYRQGDRLRDVHWGSTARTGKLIVKEHIEEYFVRVGLFVDTELKRFEKHKCFENRISLCAGIADYLNTNDVIVDLFLSDAHSHHLQIGRGVEPFNNLLELLSIIEGDRTVDFLQAASRLKEHVSQISILVLFLKDWDDRRAHFYQQLSDLGFNMRGIIVRDKPTTLAISEENISVIQSHDMHQLK